MTAAHPRDVAADNERPWERAPGETDKQFEAFRVYRDAGADRSYQQTAKDVGKSVQFMREWGAALGWRSRAAAYDAMMDREAIRQRVHEVHDMEARHAAMAAAGLGALAMPALALTRPRKLPDGSFIGRMDELEGMPTDELVRLAARAGNVLYRLVAVERLARGEPTEIVAATFESAPSAPLADEDRLAAIFQAMQEAGVASLELHAGPGELSSRNDA